MNAPLAPGPAPDLPAGPAAAEQPSTIRKALTFGLLWLAIPIALVVLAAMAASAASATGGCGGS